MAAALAMLAPVQPALAQGHSHGEPASAAAAPTPAAPKPWVATSNAITRELLALQGQFAPEFASQMGLTAFDGLVRDLSPGADERYLAAADAKVVSLRQRLASEADAEVRQDLQILIDSVQANADSTRLNMRLALDWEDAAELVFGGLRNLLDEQQPAERRAKALERLQRYLGLHPGSRSVFQDLRRRFEESRAPGRIGPVKAQVDKAQAQGATYVSGIRELFKRFPQPGMAPALDELERQVAEHSAWQQRVVLPLARSDFQGPPELYADKLRQVGIDIAPAELIRLAQVSYLETRAAMVALAPQVAAAKGWPKDLDYPGVIRRLKAETLADDQLVPHYTAVNQQLEAIIRRERIATLPDRPLGMKLASAAESAAQPAPHLRPPRLVGNAGERGIFVLPVRNPGAGAGEAYDDFNFPAAAWTLSAHEGRPGHELQFSAMVERGVSLARSLYAFNSVNVEGWALYAEAEALPHEPLDGQLIALQFRLLRAARAMLDPMLNLGQASTEDAARLLREEVGMSAAMTRQEIDRYTFRLPGQAGSYLYGYLRLLQLRADAELALGPRFNRLAFNDFVVGQGLLPPALLAKAVREQFVPARRKLAGTQ
ncbi:DUF885 domain-containing protein [Aquabacterium sp. OR-4]|uniref:DUF885 domain-containing protein n=1 Tax=Aquabacterium sp. OR-4 TaxID=2978127 RepID=UPI0028C65072|nr:DUF885 domain-containing protein [Aquabacterium sp. OR-4]MDT7838394.1 DUF885 domain-containing protein [Aquabacterium sp. OR-4]